MAKIRHGLATTEVRASPDAVTKKRVIIRLYNILEEWLHRPCSEDNVAQHAGENHRRYFRDTTRTVRGWASSPNDGMVGEIYRCWNMVLEFELFDLTFWVRGAPTCVNRGLDEDNTVPTRSKERVNTIF